MANELLIILVARGYITAPGSLRCCFSNMPQSSIHRRGPIAAFSISKSLISDTGKLEGIVKAYSMKRSHPNQLLPCASLKSFTSLDNNKSLIGTTKFRNVDIPYAAPKYRMDADTDLHIQANVCERQHCGHLRRFSHRYRNWFVTRISNRATWLHPRIIKLRQKKPMQWYEMGYLHNTVFIQKWKKLYLKARQKG